MNTAVDPLGTLKPLHLPEPVSWWPPAPGWWLIFVGVTAVIALLAIFWKKRAARREAMKILQTISEQGLHDSDLVRYLNVLLKRYALACYPDQKVAGLSGEAWLRFLRTNCPPVQADFLEDHGRLFTQDLYRPTLQVDHEAALRFVRAWIGANKPSSKRVSWSMAGWKSLLARKTV